MTNKFLTLRLNLAVRIIRTFAKLVILSELQIAHRPLILEPGHTYHPVSYNYWDLQTKVGQYL